MAESDFWNGPYGVKIFKDVKYVVDSDGRNTIYKNGCATEIIVMKPISKEEYLTTYCVLGLDGNYYWNEKLPSTLKLQ